MSHKNQTQVKISGANQCVTTKCSMSANIKRTSAISILLLVTVIAWRWDFSFLAPCVSVYNRELSSISHVFRCRVNEQGVIHSHLVFSIASHFSHSATHNVSTPLLAWRKLWRVSEFPSSCLPPTCWRPSARICISPIQSFTINSNQSIATHYQHNRKWCAERRDKLCDIHSKPAVVESILNFQLW